jgi:Zn-finger nucleic acid-binding protein
MLPPAPMDPTPPRSTQLSLRPHGEREAEALLGRVPCCPRCDVNLSPTDHATGLAWRCPRCAGSSLNFGQFRHLIPGQHADEIWTTTLDEPVSPTVRAKCPECRRNMTAVLIPFQGREIELDICRMCQRVWMELQETRPHRIDISESACVRRPPVISLTGQKARGLLGEKLAILRATLKYNSVIREPTKRAGLFFLVVVGICFLIRVWIWHSR